MSLLTELGGVVQDALTEDAVRGVLSQARERSAKALEPDEALAVSNGLTVIERHSSALAGLSRHAAAAVLTTLAGGGKPDHVLADQGLDEFAATRAQHHASTDRAIQAGDAQAQLLRDLEALGRDVGQFLLTRALPFVLAAL